jgi:hypothetical protein
MLKDGVVPLAAAGHEEYETLAKDFHGRSMTKQV